MKEDELFRKNLPPRTPKQDDVKKRIEQGMKDVSAEEYDTFVSERGRDSFAIAVKSLVASVLNPGKHYEALEIGAGTGISTRRLNEIENIHVTALDIREDYLEFGIRNGRIRSEQAVVGSFSELPFPDESFDLYVGVAILNQRADIDRFYEEMSRVLKDGGSVFIPWTKVKDGSIEREMKNIKGFPFEITNRGDWYIIGKRKPRTSSRS